MNYLAPANGRLDAVFDKFFDNYNYGSSFGKNQVPIDVWEESDKYIIEVEIPGLSREDIEVSIEGGVVTIKGRARRGIKGDDDNGRYVRRETRRAAFQRSIAIPRWADGSSSTAEIKNGILCITLNKPESAKPKILEIKQED